MTDTLERMAKAIYDELYKRSLDSISHEEDWQAMSDQFVCEARAAAQVLLRDMMEPTNETLDSVCILSREFHATRVLWRAMIRSFAKSQNIDIEGE